MRKAEFILRCLLFILVTPLALMFSYVIVIGLIALGIWNGELFNTMVGWVWNTVTLRLFVYSAIVAIPWGITHGICIDNKIDISDIKKVIKRKRTKPKASGELSISKEEGGLSLL